MRKKAAIAAGRMVPRPQLELVAKVACIYYLIKTIRGERVCVGLNNLIGPCVKICNE